MKPAYLHTRAATGSHRDRWMISYVDVLTILLVFFIAAAAKTLPGENTPPPAPPPAPAPAAVVEAPKIEPRSPLEDALDTLKEHGIEAKLETRGLMISLPQTILYAPGDDQVTADAKPVVAAIADVLMTLPNRVNLIGHADSSPIHNRRFKNNWELSAARGLRLLELLSTKYGLDETRLSVSSDGANSPIESNDTPEGRASNRRVEILILNERADPRSSAQIGEAAPEF
jgi:chemotaxis protein MotB